MKIIQRLYLLLPPIGNEDQLKLGAFVYVRLPTKCSHRHYVGKIILKDVDDGISVEFMQKNKLTPHTFVAAASENISSVEESWIIQDFRPPKIDRRGGFIIPEIDRSLKWEQDVFFYLIVVLQAVVEHQQFAFRAHELREARHSFAKRHKKLR